LHIIFDKAQNSLELCLLIPRVLFENDNKGVDFPMLMQPAI